MERLLLFSVYFRPIIRRAQLIAIVCGRAFVVLFRWDKRIQLLKLEYAKEHVFVNSYLKIDYQFKNVLWFKVMPLGFTTSQSSLIINLEVLNAPLFLVAYGFFQRKVIPLQFVPQHRLNNAKFKTTVVRGIGPEAFHKRIEIKVDQPSLHVSSIQCKHENLILSHHSFNKLEFI
jgi:hypothetical protein